MGFVYVASNPWIPGLLKVGHTTDLQNRLETLSNTSVPGRFSYEFHVESFLSETIEKMAHSLLEEKRVDPSKEFFSCSVSEAKGAIEKALRQAMKKAQEDPSPVVIKDFIPEQYRLAIDAGDLYDGWIDVRRLHQKGRLRWKTVAGVDYLYRMNFGNGNGKSLGRRSVETEELFQSSMVIEEQSKNGWERLLFKGRLMKAAKLPLVSGFVSETLRILDVEGLLGNRLWISGDAAIPAYQMEAGAILSPVSFSPTVLHLEFSPEDREKILELLVDLLRKEDSTWCFNKEREGCLQNKKGFQIEVSNVLGNFLRSEQAVTGKLISHVVCDVYGKPCRIVAPDPRLFALHKLHMANVEGRNPFKREKDLQQADAILTLVEERMPHYPLDEDFRKELAPELSRCLAAWEESRRPSPPSKPSRARLG